MPRRPPCVYFCGAPASKQEEHALPQQVLRRYEPDTFGTTVNNVDDGRRVDSLMRWKLPVCVGCNAWLEHTYENRVTNFLLAVLGRSDDGQTGRLAALDAVETRGVAEWAVKTLLLMRHPQTRRRWAGTSSLVDDPWPLTEGQMRAWRANGELPQGLRLWIARTDAQLGDAEMIRDSRHLIPAGSQAAFVGLGTRGHGELLLCLGWQVPDHLVHPMAGVGLARELWPQVPASFDLADLPLLSATGRNQFVRGFLLDKTGDTADKS